jgi:hypothetical protein
MNPRLILILVLLFALTACGSPQPSTPTSVPETQPTSAPPTTPPTAVPPTNTAAPAATQPAPTGTPAPPNTSAPQPTNTATAAPAATRPRPTPTSSGPLQAAIYAANCRSEPSADKPGRVIIQISVEATGGTGRYTYTYQNQNYSTKFIDVIGEKGTRSIGEVLITSGDQQLKKEFDISPADLTCP